MKYKIVSDSASDILSIEGVPFASVPLHIIVDEEDFVDDAKVDLKKMQDALLTCRRSGTACPSAGDWIHAFENAETVFCVTITGALSGSCAAAQAAKQEYEEDDPSRHVYIIDSLSTGPEMTLIVEKLRDLILSGMDGPSVYQAILEYAGRTHLLFSLECLDNLAKNGRVSHAAAKLAGILGIRVVGKASEHGELQLLSKCRGEQRALQCVVKYMKELGYTHGKVYITHNQNENAAQKLTLQIQKEFPDSIIQIRTTQALCSYYAEKGGLLVGFEC